jgi:hypothetical protein
MAGNFFSNKVANRRIDKTVDDLTSKVMPIYNIRLTFANVKLHLTGTASPLPSPGIENLSPRLTLSPYLPVFHSL